MGLASIRRPWWNVGIVTEDSTELIRWNCICLLAIMYEILDSNILNQLAYVIYTIYSRLFLKCNIYIIYKYILWRFQVTVDWNSGNFSKGFYYGNL